MPAPGHSHRGHSARGRRKPTASRVKYSARSTYRLSPRRVMWYRYPTPSRMAQAAERLSSQGVRPMPPPPRPSSSAAPSRGK